VRRKSGSVHSPTAICPAYPPVLVSAARSSSSIRLSRRSFALLMPETARSPVIVNTNFTRSGLPFPAVPLPLRAAPRVQLGGARSYASGSGTPEDCYHRRKRGGLCTVTELQPPPNKAYFCFAIYRPRCCDGHSGGSYVTLGRYRLTIGDRIPSILSAGRGNSAEPLTYEPMSLTRKSAGATLLRRPTF
jgi:hypothetical protein